MKKAALNMVILAALSQEVSKGEDYLAMMEYSYEACYYIWSSVEFGKDEEWISQETAERILREHTGTDCVLKEFCEKIIDILNK